MSDEGEHSIAIASVSNIYGIEIVPGKIYRMCPTRERVFVKSIWQTGASLDAIVHVVKTDGTLGARVVCELGNLELEG